MAKNMARIENYIVINIESWGDMEQETDCLKDVNDYPVAIGDSYSNGSFYRNGVKVLSPIEAVQEQADAQIMELLDVIEELIIGG